MLCSAGAGGKSNNGVGVSYCFSDGCADGGDDEVAKLRFAPSDTRKTCWITRIIDPAVSDESALLLMEGKREGAFYVVSVYSVVVGGRLLAG